MALLHFVGGPMDGRSIEWRDFPSEFLFPVQPPITWLGLHDELVPLAAIYRRRSGVVASEAKYDWIATR